MTERKYPFVSVVVITFNRSKLISPCLESLGKQTYPKDRYEVIVVDDGSTDDTAQIAEAHGVKVVRHAKNRGTPIARNTGLAAVKGEIIAYIDDDAVADPEWLHYLLRPFEDPKVTATGGQTFAYKTEYLAERYLSATGYGNPAPLAFGTSKNPLWRFFIYLKDMFVPISIATEPTEVQAVFGLNCAFHISALRTIGGFDERMAFAEDSEISTRLREQGARIIFEPQAIIHHRHREGVAYLIRQTYYRTGYLIYYYTKEKKPLPVFPLPFLYVIMIAAFFFFFAPIIGLLFIVFGPLILYPWWPIRAFREDHSEYLLYGYIQLALEVAAILGMVRGRIHGTKR